MKKQNGHWADDDPMPKSGWSLIDTEDTGEFGSVICKMCCVQRLRYRVKMTHPDGFELWTGEECAGRMMGDEELSHQVFAKLVYQAKKLAERSRVIEGWSRVSPLASCSVTGAPWARLETCAFITLLPTPKPRRVKFHEGISGELFLCEDGCHLHDLPLETAILYAVAHYVTKPDAAREGKFQQSPDQFPTCRFGALLLREEDRLAIKELTNDKPASYIMLLDHSKREETRWIESGPSKVGDSLAFLMKRGSKFVDAEGRWDVTKVLSRPYQVTEAHKRDMEQRKLMIMLADEEAL